MSKENKTLDNHKSGNDLLANVTSSIKSVSNGWGEESTYISVGTTYNNRTISKIKEETKIIGKGYYYDNLTIKCYVAYDNNDKPMISINDGYNVEVIY